MPYIITGILAISPWHIMMIRFSLMWGVYMKSNKRYMNCITALLCFCTTLFFNISFSQPEITGNAGVIYSISENIRQSLKNDFFMMTIMFVALYYINLEINKKIEYRIPSLYFVNILLAILWLISEGFRINDTTTMLFSSAGQAAKSIIYVIGAAHLLNCLGILLYYLFKTKINADEEKVSRNIIERFYSKHTYVALFFLMIIVWIPNTIISHPASIECDVWDSLLQYFGKATFTAHHPPVFTVLVGWAASFGLSVGDINTGFFLWVVLQTIMAAAIMAYALYTMKIMKAPKWIIILTIFIAALSPYYMCYVTTIVKDTPFSFAVLLYMVELVYMHLDWNKYWKSARHIGLYGIATMVMLLIRHNGKYIAAVMLIYILLKCICNRANYSWKYIASVVIWSVLPLLLATGISETVNSHYNVTVQEGESMREALSIPFQQTARYAKYYDAETSEEDKATIDKVIDYYALAGVYEPVISDPVKSRFHYYATQEDWKDYFKVWFKNFWKHPLTYFGATFDQNYYIIYPMKENIRLYYSTYVDYFWDHNFMDELGAAQTMTFEKANDMRISSYKLLQVLPITGVFSSLPVYNIILIYLILFTLHDRRKGFLWLTIPVILSDLIVVAGPAIYDNIRYALPIIYSMPLVVAYYLYVYQKVENIK